MKKGVVLSVNKFSITLLTPNGEFDKSRRLNRNYEIGEEINYQPMENRLKSFLYFPGKQTAVISAVVTCILLFSILSPRFSTHVSAYMTIDVNPSIELGLDDELQVVEMKGINADGKRVISKINGWKNKNVSDVAEEIVLKEKELGYINDVHRRIIISKTMIEEDKELDKKLNQEIKSFTNDITIPRTEVKLIQATEHDRNKAKQQGISTGKFIDHKLNEEKRKKKKLDLEKKKGQPSKNTTNSCVKKHKISKKVDSKEKYTSKHVNQINQHVTDNQHHTSVKDNKNQKGKTTVKINKVNHSENKGQIKNKKNLKIKKSSGNKEEALVKSSVDNKKKITTGSKEKTMIKSNVDNKEKIMVKTSIDSKEKTMVKSSVDNKESLMTKSRPGNKGNLMGKNKQRNKGNLKMISNPGHSGYKGNPGHSGHSGYKGNPGIIELFLRVSK